MLLANGILPCLPVFVRVQKLEWLFEVVEVAFGLPAGAIGIADEGIAVTAEGFAGAGVHEDGITFELNVRDLLARFAVVGVVLGEHAGREQAQ